MKRAGLVTRQKQEADTLYLINMPTPDNYLTLTEEKKKKLRELSDKYSVDYLVQLLYPTSRHEVMKVIMKEKLPMKKK